MNPFLLLMENTGNKGGENRGMSITGWRPVMHMVVLVAESKVKAG